MDYLGTNDPNNFEGTAGNDNMQGNGGNDTLSGAGGDDYIDGGAGNDVIDGGAGTFDQVAYGGATTGVNVDLTAGTASDGQGGTDTISNVEVVIGTGFDDTLKGNGANNFFRPGTGNDKVDGAVGNDFVAYETDVGPVTVNLLAGTATGANIGTDTLVSIESVNGSQLADLLTLSNVAGTANGRAGNDTLVGGTGDDFFTGGRGDDSINGGTGFDAANYLDEIDDGKAPLTGKGVTVNLVTGVAIDNWGNKDTLVSIELAYGSRFDDVLTGGNPVNGSGASDGFEGYRGNAGNDTLEGGTGFDRAMYDNSPAAIVALFTGNGNATVQDGWGNTDTLTSFEEIRGSAFDDVFTGSDGSLLESFEGRAGNDKMDGRGGGADRVSYQSAPSGVIVNLASGTASDGYGTNDTFVNIEQANGSDFSDLLSGSDLANTLLGRAGDDKLYGGAGADFLQGGAGDDYLDGGSNLASVNNGAAEYDSADYAAATSGITVVLGVDGTKGTATGGGVGTDTLVDIERIYGSAFNDTISGTNRAVNEIFRGGLGDDIIRGSAATGTDLGLNLAEYNTASGGIVGNLATGKVTGPDGDDTLIDIQGILGSNFADQLTGDGNRNVFRGYGGSDSFDGAGGTDDIVLYDGVPANFKLQKSGAVWTVTDKVGTEGVDTLVNIEYVRLGNGTPNVPLANPAPATPPGFGQTDSFLFDSVYYVLNNRSLGLDLAGAAQNYLSSGAAQGLKPNSWFDPVYYANRWADLKGLDLDAATLFKHYNLYGVWEGRSGGTAFDKFDGSKYLGDNPDVAAYVDAHLPDFLGSRSNGAIAHYVIYGSGEGRAAVDTVGQPIKLDYAVEFV